MGQPRVLDPDMHLSLASDGHYWRELSLDTCQTEKITPLNPVQLMMVAITIDLAVIADRNSEISYE